MAATTPPLSYGQTNSTVWGPYSIVPNKQQPSKEEDAIEVSLHTLPKQLQREFQHVFPEHQLQLDDCFNNQKAADNCEFLIVPTNQRARLDLVAIGPDIEMEKDRLLQVFMDFARHLCDDLRTKGYWSDYIDPCSGLAMLSRNCNKVYSEVDGMECTLNYQSYNAGCCKILNHPKFGSAVYPASLFCYAPRHVVLQLLQEYPTATTTVDA